MFRKFEELLRNNIDGKIEVCVGSHPVHALQIELLEVYEDYIKFRHPNDDIGYIPISAITILYLDWSEET